MTIPVDTETLLTGMAAHQIVPLIGNQARRGRVIMHAESITKACEELVRRAEGAIECAASNHVRPDSWIEPAAYICGRCGSPVMEETHE